MAAVLGQLVSDGQGRLHRALRHLLQRLWNAKDSRERCGRVLENEASESLDLLRESLVPASRQRPGFNMHSVMLHGLWPRHIDRQHYHRLLLPGRFQRRAIHAGGTALIRLKGPYGFLFLTTMGRCQRLPARTSNAIPAHPIA